VCLLRQCFCAKKLQSQNLTLEMVREALLYKKFACKMLMKLTPGVNFINILHAKKITKPNVTGLKLLAGQFAFAQKNAREKC
jgi:hypothetical protein